METTMLSADNVVHNDLVSKRLMHLAKSQRFVGKTCTFIGLVANIVVCEYGIC